MSTSSPRQLFVTTALPYANGAFHIGHIMEYIQADIWVRFQRMQRDGDAVREVHFVGADDTHGTPIMIAAEKEGITPQEFVAKIAAGPIDWVKVVSKELWFASSGVVDKSAIEGRVYQKDGSKWLSYVLTARSKMVRNYQFRSPAEWFAEVYAVSMLGKLSSTHPCANDIKTIDTTKKIGT